MASRAHCSGLRGVRQGAKAPRLQRLLDEGWVPFAPSSLEMRRKDKRSAASELRARRAHVVLSPMICVCVHAI
eukprot:1851056-Alexandrium_andersonii.AAC.1